jgi:hypothetical protein
LFLVDRHSIDNTHPEAAILNACRAGCYIGCKKGGQPPIVMVFGHAPIRMGYSSAAPAIGPARGML